MKHNCPWPQGVETRASCPPCDQATTGESGARSRSQRDSPQCLAPAPVCVVAPTLALSHFPHTLPQASQTPGSMTRVPGHVSTHHTCPCGSQQLGCRPWGTGGGCRIHLSSPASSLACWLTLLNVKVRVLPLGPGLLFSLSASFIQCLSVQKK